MENECRGCRSYYDDYGCMGKVLPHKTETLHCPCMNCLVKGMCKDVCDDFLIYLSVTKHNHMVIIKNGK